MSFAKLVSDQKAEQKANADEIAQLTKERDDALLQAAQWKQKYLDQVNIGTFELLGGLLGGGVLGAWIGHSIK